jgi:beta-lysine 5,6-aminomutase beta subunit
MSSGLYSTNKREFDKTFDPAAVKAYGDTMNDGKVQLSFTLPLPYGDEAKEAARQLAMKMGLEEPGVTHMMDLGVGYTYFVVFGSCVHSVDSTKIVVPKVESTTMSMEETDEYIRKNIGRKIVVVGACTGTDAHTVGIDAIMNMKGFAGHYGLERYQMIEAYNLGSQVQNEELVATAIEKNADAILVSQVVTQKNVHIPNMTELVDIVEAEGLRDRVILVAGGPRITHELAKEIGYDAGFGSGSYADDVASFIVQEMVKREMK